MTIENDLTRIAVALEGILEHLKGKNAIISASGGRLSPDEEQAPTVEMNKPVDPATLNANNVTEPPKKKRGRPSKADLAARADTAMDAVQAEVREDEAAHVAAKGPAMTATYLDEVGPAPAALPVEQPKCPDCGTVLTPENSAKSGMTGKLFHVNCKAEPKPATAEQVLTKMNEVPAPAAPNAETEKAIEKAREPVLTIEKVREAAIALTQRCEKEKAGSGRDALVAVLAKFSAKSISELPEAKWPEFVSSLKAA